MLLFLGHLEQSTDTAHKSITHSTFSIWNVWILSISKLGWFWRADIRFTKPVQIFRSICKDSIYWWERTKHASFLVRVFPWAFSWSISFFLMYTFQWDYNWPNMFLGYTFDCREMISYIANTLIFLLRYVICLVERQSSNLIDWVLSCWWMKLIEVVGCY